MNRAMQMLVGRMAPTSNDIRRVGISGFTLWCQVEIRIDYLVSKRPLCRSGMRTVWLANGTADYRQPVGGGQSPEGNEDDHQ